MVDLASYNYRYTVGNGAKIKASDKAEIKKVLSRSSDVGDSIILASGRPVGLANLPLTARRSFRGFPTIREHIMSTVTSIYRDIPEQLYQPIDAQAYLLADRERKRQAAKQPSAPIPCTYEAQMMLRSELL